MTAGWVIEGWRGLAACMVVFAHYGVVPGASWAISRFTFTGVDLFFVLSGFVFAPYFFGQPVAWRGFAVKRFFRIYPAYFLALLGYFFLKYLSGQPLEFVWQHLTFAHLQSREMAFYYNPVFWSLPSEVAFYVALPLMAWACRGRPVVVVALMVVATALPGEAGIEAQGQAAESIVPALGAGQERAVHGVVGDDEQACLQEGSSQHRQDDQGRRQRGSIKGEQHGQAGGAAQGHAAHAVDEGGGLTHARDHRRQ